MIPLTILYAFFLLWGVVLQFLPEKSGIINFVYNSYAILYFIGAFIGLYNAFKLSLKSTIGKAMFFLSLGIGSYGLGLLLWLYYNLVSHIAIPYPSFSDAFFILFIPLVAVGCFFLLSMFTKLITRSLILQSLGIIVTAGVLVLGIVNKPNTSTGVSALTIFFNFAYPVGDTILVSLALIALRIGGGKMHEILKYLIAGLLFQSLADFFFTYRSSNTIYWNGDISDMLFASSGFMLSATVLKIRQFFSGSSAPILLDQEPPTRPKTDSPVSPYPQSLS